MLRTACSKRVNLPTGLFTVFVEMFASNLVIDAKKGTIMV
jgi:hypothetical protein